MSCADLTVRPAPEVSGKAARLMEILDEILPTNQKVVVFVMRKAVLALLRDLVADLFNRDGRCRHAWRKEDGE